MPLYLPELLNYLDQPQQLQDHHYKSINTILHKSRSSTTESPYSRLRIFPCNTNYYSTIFSLQPAKHLHHRSATTTVSVAVQTSSTHSLPTTMQAWTTASAKSRTTESTTGLSTCCTTSSYYEMTESHLGFLYSNFTFDHLKVS